MWAQIRLLLQEQSDLGLHCSSKSCWRQKQTTCNVIGALMVYVLIAYLNLCKLTFMSIASIRVFTSIMVHQTAMTAYKVWNPLRKSYIASRWSHSWKNIGIVTVLTLNEPIATKVVCFSHLLKCLRSLYGKQCGPRSDCSYRSSLFWVHPVCFYT